MSPKGKLKMGEIMCWPALMKSLFHDRIGEVELVPLTKINLNESPNSAFFSPYKLFCFSCLVTYTEPVCHRVVFHLMSNTVNTL